MKQRGIMIDPYVIDDLYEHNQVRNLVRLAALKDELEGYEFIDVSPLVEARKRNFIKIGVYNISGDIYPRLVNDYSEMMSTYKDFFQSVLLEKDIWSLAKEQLGVVYAKLDVIEPSGLITIRLS